MNCLKCGRVLKPGETCEWHIERRCFGTNGRYCGKHLSYSPCPPAQNGQVMDGLCDPCVAEFQKAPAT